MRVIEKTATRLVLANRSLKYQIIRNYIVAAVFSVSAVMIGRVLSINSASAPKGFLTTLTCKRVESEVTCTVIQVDTAGNRTLNQVIRQVQGATAKSELISYREMGDSDGPDTKPTYTCQIKLITQKGIMVVPQKVV